MSDEIRSIEDGGITRWFHVTTKDGKSYTVYANYHHMRIDYTDVDVENTYGRAEVPSSMKGAIKAAVLKHMEEERRAEQ